jgi:hypothetical protein
MKNLLLAGAVVLAASPALAETSFHVGGILAFGSDPVVLAQHTEFSITRISGGASISAPLTVYFAVPVGEAAPSVANQSFDGGPVIPAVLDTTSFVGQWSPGTVKDLYTFVGCTACDNSLNAGNVSAVEPTITAFNVFSVTVNQAFPNKNDVEDFNGSFSFGTIIAPLAVSGGKVFDTSWTNTGVVDSAVVPEPSTWLLGLTGVGFLAALGWKRRREGY